MTYIYHLNRYRLLNIKSFVTVILTQLDWFSWAVYLDLVILLDQAFVSFLLFNDPLGLRLFDYLVSLQSF